MTSIFNRDWEENLKHIQQLLNISWQNKLYTNLEKSSFGMQRIQYLGYIMDEHSVHVDPVKVQAIHNWLAPKTLVEIHSFLGLINFYYKFMLGFSHILGPWAR